MAQQELMTVALLKKLLDEYIRQDYVLDELGGGNVGGGEGAGGKLEVRTQP